MITLKKPKATKRSGQRTISLTADTAKIEARILRRIERKIEDVFGEDRFGFNPSAPELFFFFILAHPVYKM